MVPASNCSTFMNGVCGLSPRRSGDTYTATVSEGSDLVASGYEAFYATWGESPTLRRIWREHVTGPDYPEEFAHISFLPLAQLRSLTEG